MIGSVPTSRRANAFAQLLDDTRLEEQRPGVPGGEEADTADTTATPAGAAAPAAPAAGSSAAAAEGGQAALAAVARRLAALPRPSLSADAKAEQRARLVAAMEAAAPGALRVPEQRRHRPGRGAHRATPANALNRLRPRSRLSKGLAASGLTVGVAAGALGGIAAASSDALPGDTLYGIKRGMEDLRLDFASGDADRGRLYLDHAATRLNEARRLMERGRSGQLAEEDLDDIRAALASMRDDAAEGHRLLTQAHEADGSMAPLESLSVFSVNHREAWSRLRDQLPPELVDVGAQVTEVFDAIEDEIAPLAPLLPTEPRTSASSDDTAGERPRTPGDSPEPAEPASPDEDQPQAPSGTAPGPASPAPSEDDEGLLGGTGLLDPPASDQPSGGAADAETAPPGTSLPQPEITIPPLVEELLPGLGLDGSGTDQ
ncbi:DUF5667 domain-containing protein [Streptomyces sp. 7-21]|uniref:DUF5667 domain-containing protein n=1 Tax=Streptomyces sp. 7-21 TaxID=2802283 RepID=UPI00191CAD18|nr:DUF5667 domain-containing protein [Streptomyces sp. 7-21]MBL1068990.1 hypothetical protein [Streptomyces sp. 7-21]